ncbi:MAG TPA: M14 family zinc carboxypeptidase [Pyrinomonadaceae bacterium]
MISTGRTFFALLLLLTLCLFSASAQRDDSQFDFYARGPFRESVPRPQSLLRFDVGSFHTNYAQMERVVEKIAGAAPDRVRITDIGETNEHRMMHLVAISAPENIARLDEIKDNIARLSDPRTLTPAEAQRLIAELPIIVWLNYAIHGNESASFEAMMQVVYQLAASNEQATLDILKNTVVLVNVCANPDGHERFVTWYNSVGTGNPEPLAAEHREPWAVYGRLNHYRFDLNRDNIASTQIETRNVERAYLEWNPQVFVDHHGQPTQFFFPPAAEPINPNLPSAPTARWLSTFGRANAAQFDARNWDFYTRDVYDLFYPGYWDSWPSLNGATGMTYETDGGGFKGINWKRDDDTIVTLRSGIAKHFVASLATLETAAHNRAERLRDYYEFKQSAIEEGRKQEMKRIVLVPHDDLPKTLSLVEVLLRAGIEVRVARAPFRSTGAHAYTEAQAPANPRSFQAGAFVIDLAQPQKRLAKSLLEPNTEQGGGFIAEQLARFARNERRGSRASKEEYGFYDITAWSLPLAFGVEAFWTEDAPEFEGSMVRLPQPGDETRPPASPARSFATVSGLLGDNYNIGVIGGRAAVAYIIPYKSDGAASLAFRLQREGFRIAVATRVLTAGGREWPRGTMVVRVSRNPASLHERIAQLAREAQAEVWPVNTGFTETGETNIGSENVVSLKQPRIIVVADEAVSQNSYGSLWWVFDRYGVDFTPMTIANLKRAELDRYNVIILPDGSPGQYLSAFGKGGIEILRAWCERGGTLVCIKGAAVFAALKDVNLTSSRLVGSDDDDQESKESEEPEPTPSPTPETAAAENRREQTGAARDKSSLNRTATEQRRAEANQTEKLEGAAPVLPPIASPSARPGRVPEAIPGAILRATVDRTTPLTYGYEDPQLPVLIDSAYFFRPSKEGTNAVVFASTTNQPLRIAGFVWPGNTERLLRGTAYVFEEPTGRGHVVLYAEDPNYRGIWRNMTRLFFNSFIFQPTF